MQLEICIPYDFFCFMTITGSAQSLFLPLNTGIIPGRFKELYGMLGNKLR